METLQDRNLHTKASNTYGVGVYVYVCGVCVHVWCGVCMCVWVCCVCGVLCMLCVLCVGVCVVGRWVGGWMGGWVCAGECLMAVNTGNQVQPD